MKIAQRSLTCTFIAIVALAVTATAQNQVQNGRMTPQAAGTSLVQSVRSIVSAQAEPAWIGYSVPVVDGERTMCCFNSGTTWINGNVVTSDGSACCGMCRLEQGSGTSMVTRPQSTTAPIKLEGSSLMTVLIRVENRAVDRVRVFSEDCAIDAGGRQVFWIDNVRAADSVALLESLTGDVTDRKDRVASGAISALGLHADASADATLINLARTHKVPSIRSEAIFWLGQKAGMKAAGAITERIDNDPETDVKKRAVFALSQMPRNEGVPLLINVARTHSNAAVRKQAMFWLGQSKDPRAIDFFAEVLSK